ncbi:hypothetical protein TRFO_29492 [Tritrichomonas foetus]|uniref:Chromo domain-containing protein n=1 Tax=Tritrichomonas foetus TaxID=1144522 RepID=A0A1J4K084_9EUKA|nr:hypothetical protein TRFO_29492 [Tritrichomonas foetus]|eukprot:OHT03188.1 hypothetical protein TRFO_29492 [Tritrichomonas foetus]
MNSESISKRPISIEGEHRSRNGIKHYLVKWELENGDTSFSWVSEMRINQKEETFLRYIYSSSISYQNAESQTSGDAFVFEEPSDSPTIDFFRGYGPTIYPPPKIDEEYSYPEDEDFLPNSILQFDRTTSKFQITNADKPGLQWIDASVMITVAPELVSQFFIERAKLKAK